MGEETVQSKQSTTILDELAKHKHLKDIHVGDVSGILVSMKTLTIAGRMNLTETLKALPFIAKLRESINLLNRTGNLAGVNKVVEIYLEVLKDWVWFAIGLLLDLGPILLQVSTKEQRDKLREALNTID